jgi:hypothetical protein
MTLTNKPEVLMHARSRSHRLAASAVSALLILASCKDNPAAPIEGGGDPENISRVAVTLTQVGATTTTTSVVVDADGTQGINAPSAAQGTLTLTKGATYTGAISLKNDIDPNNVIDISAEVKKEANFHRFFYTFTTGCTGVTVDNLDVDTQSPPQPVGLTFQVNVPAGTTSGSCTLHVELHHFETAKGNGLGTTFDTDLSLNFPVIVP